MIPYMRNSRPAVKWPLWAYTIASSASSQIFGVFLGLDDAKEARRTANDTSRTHNVLSYRASLHLDTCRTEPCT